MVWLDPSVASLFMGSSIPQTDAGIGGVLFTFAQMHILWLGVTRYFVCIYVSFPQIGWEASFPVGTFLVSCIFQGQKGLLILTSHFCSFSLLLFSHFPSACGVSNFLRCTFCPLSSQFPPDFKVCSLFKLYFLSDFLSFEFLISFSLHFRLVSSVLIVGYSEIQRTSPSVAFLFARLGALLESSIKS